MKSFCCLLALCFTTWAVRPGFAQYGIPSLGGGISVSATERISVKPEKLRLIMWIQAQGKDPKAAVTALNEHKDRVKTELSSMKAVTESIQFSAARVTSDKSKNKMQQMMMSNMPGRKKSKSKPTPSIYIAKCATKAEWPLPIKEGDALALLPATLLEQIQSRDLEGKNNKSELDAEEKERLEEMDQMVQENFYGDNANDQGPQIAFIAIASDEQIEQASQKAFEAAVKEAQSLSKSTSVKLGKLNSLSRTPHGDPSGTSENVYTPYAYASGFGGPVSLPKDFLGDEKHAVNSKNADDLSLSVTVSLTYFIE